MSSLEHPERPAGVPERDARPPIPDRPWSAWWAIPIAMATVVVATFAYILASALHDALTDSPVHQAGAVGVALHGAPPVISFISTLGQDLTAVAGAILVAAYSLKGRLTPAHFGLRSARPASSAGYIVLGYLVFVLFSLLWLSITGNKESQNIRIQLGTEDSAGALVLAAVLTCVIAPICEELFFRGFIFGGVRKHGLVPAVLISGLAFGAVHVASSPIAYLLPLAVLGVILALLYEKTGSLYPAIGLHALNNSIAFAVGDGRAWMIPVCLVMAAVAVWGIARAAGRPQWRTVVTTS